MTPTNCNVEADNFATGIAANGANLPLKAR